MTVKKGALVYVSGYYNQSSSTVNYTITANGTTTAALNANSYVVATEDQVVTITGTGNNYLQAIYVVYPIDETASFVANTGASNATYTAEKALQYSVYNVNGIIINTAAADNGAKVTARANEYGQFNKGSQFVVNLQKGQKVSVKTYNGDATLTYSVLGGEATSITNAGAQTVTEFTATQDYTVVVVTAVSNDYVAFVTVE